MVVSEASLLIVDDLNALGAVNGPDEADAIRVVDSDAVLTGTIAFEFFQPVSGGTRNVASETATCAASIDSLASRTPHGSDAAEWQVHALTHRADIGAIL